MLMRQIAYRVSWSAPYRVVSTTAQHIIKQCVDVVSEMPFWTSIYACLTCRQCIRFIYAIGFVRYSSTAAARKLGIMLRKARDSSFRGFCRPQPPASPSHLSPARLPQVGPIGCWGRENRSWVMYIKSMMKLLR